MDYFSILNLDREPFSNSPDPEFFFQSKQHVDCLQKLELALRLKRGLNIVIGAVGSGKTTLCRALLKKFALDSAIESHLILDPSFNSPSAFLEAICSMIVGKKISGGDAHRFKEQIKQHLFRKGVEENKTVILIIDEGQKLPGACLEILREFLNYETNDHKLLQIVVFAQEEFQATLDRRANLADRVNLIHFLGPMSLADTRRMIHFRIRHASSHPRPPKLFGRLALWAIYRTTGGYPRKIINLSHQCMLALIVQNRTCAGWRLVRSCTDRSLAQRSRPRLNSRPVVFSALAVFAAIGLVYLVAPGLLPSISISVGGHAPSAMPERKPTLPPKVTSPAAPELPLPSTPTQAGIAMALANQPADPTVSTTANMVPPPLPGKSSAICDTPEPPDEAHPIATSDPQPAQADILNSDPPALLGALTVKPNDTLGQMVKVVYGDLRSRYLKAVLDANPHIGHVDAIRVGDTIAFPILFWGTDIDDRGMQVNR